MNFIKPKNEETKKREDIPDKSKKTLPGIEEPIFHQSLCSIDPQQQAYFKEIMGSKKFRTELRYRGSRDGWMIADFHRMSDGKGPTVSLFKIKDNNQCIGGFTSAKWNSISKYVTDSSAFLFNLTTKQ